MYITQNIANRIKERLRTQNRSMKAMLTDLDMGINSISEFAKGKQMSCISLAQIADYLNCSVDYLLGRTDNPDNINIIKIAGRDGSFRERQLTDKQLAALNAIIDQMPDASDDP